MKPLRLLSIFSAAIIFIATAWTSPSYSGSVAIDSENGEGMQISLRASIGTKNSAMAADTDQFAKKGMAIIDSGEDMAIGEDSQGMTITEDSAGIVITAGTDGMIIVD